jgi:hypothetical protein
MRTARVIFPLSQKLRKSWWYKDDIIYREIPDLITFPLGNVDGILNIWT